MTDRANDLPTIEHLIRGDGPDAARRVLHWYDLAWLVGGHLIPGLYPPEQFEALLRSLVA